MALQSIVLINHLFLIASSPSLPVPVGAKLRPSALPAFRSFSATLALICGSGSAPPPLSRRRLQISPMTSHLLPFCAWTKLGGRKRVRSGRVGSPEHNLTEIVPLCSNYFLYFFIFFLFFRLFLLPLLDQCCVPRLNSPPPPAPPRAWDGRRRVTAGQPWR